MRIKVPAAGESQARDARRAPINEDAQVKAWWHVSNVNAVKRLEINDHSWVHIQIVTNIALKLLRQLTKHHVEPAMVRDYGMSRDDAEIVVVLGALLHCIGMAVHREGTRTGASSSPSRRCASSSTASTTSPERTVVIVEVSARSRATGRTASRSRSRPGSCASPTRSTWRRALADPVRARARLHPLALRGGDRQCPHRGRRARADLDRDRDEQLVRRLPGGRAPEGEAARLGLEPYVEVVARIDTEAEKSLIPLYRLEL
jgi:hypothetical protein